MIGKVAISLNDKLFCHQAVSVRNKDLHLFLFRESDHNILLLQRTPIFLFDLCIYFFYLQHSSACLTTIDFKLFLRLLYLQAFIKYRLNLSLKYIS